MSTDVMVILCFGAAASTERECQTSLTQKPRWDHLACDPAQLMRLSPRVRVLALLGAWWSNSRSPLVSGKREKITYEIRPTVNYVFISN